MVFLVSWDESHSAVGRAINERPSRKSHLQAAPRCYHSGFLVGRGREPYSAMGGADLKPPAGQGEASPGFRGSPVLQLQA